MDRTCDNYMIKNVYFDGKIEGKNYKIIELKDRTGFIILDEQNEEILLNDIFISEISELIFKTEILIDNLLFRKEKAKEKLKELSYAGIVEIIILCIKTNSDSEDKEKSKNNMTLNEIKELIKKVDDELNNRLSNRNKMYYFSTYLLVLVSSFIVYIFIKNTLTIDCDTLDLIKTINMGILGGFIAVNYRLAYRESFNATYSYMYYSMLALGRACYSMIAGVVAYYLFYSEFIKLQGDSNSNLVYLLAISLGYGIRYMPSILGNVASLGSVASKVDTEENNLKNEKTKVVKK